MSAISPHIRVLRAEAKMMRKMASAGVRADTYEALTTMASVKEAVADELEAEEKAAEDRLG